MSSSVLFRGGCPPNHFQSFIEFAVTERRQAFSVIPDSVLLYRQQTRKRSARAVAGGTRLCGSQVACKTVGRTCAYREEKPGEDPGIPQDQLEGGSGRIRKEMGWENTIQATIQVGNQWCTGEERVVRDMTTKQTFRLFLFRTTEKTNVKKRQTKATQAQIDYMVDYFIQHLHVATGKFNTLQGNSDLRASWEQLVSDLNKMSKDGKTKDMKSWKSTWRDNKTAVSQKVAKIRENRVTTGNRSGPPLKLTEREEKILGIMGFDYVEGVQCPDSFPEEQVITNYDTVNYYYYYGFSF
ncbi:hypothetical protein DMN91_005112 [Ooceraea biroi]|uniref:Regulatory protein zeste n=1 Tax=Ooceraea biroi TaxID=2015173 RepID=A0A3L8DQX6_OOCBI|nr:hypothetical protein DMN91_005112 [Ooceraea biroi]